MALIPIRPILAHEKWFVDARSFPLTLDPPGVNRTFLALALAGAALALAFLVDRLWQRRPARRTPADLTKSQQNGSPAHVRNHGRAALVGKRPVTRSFDVPAFVMVTVPARGVPA